jgi:hypothetical protein
MANVLKVVIGKSTRYRNTLEHKPVITRSIRDGVDLRQDKRVATMAKIIYSAPFPLRFEKAY